MIFGQGRLDVSTRKISEMKSLRTFVLLTGIAAFAVCILPTRSLGAPGIDHVEYAAANYSGKFNGNPDHQFASLKLSIVGILRSHAPHGRIFINDLLGEGARNASDYVKNYMEMEGLRATVRELEPLDLEASRLPLDHIEIIPLVGDLTKIDLPKTRTAMLRNPEPHLLLALIKTESRGSKLNERILKLVHASESGLQIVSYHNNFPQGSESDWTDHLLDYHPVDVNWSFNDSYYDFSNGPTDQKAKWKSYYLRIPNLLAMMNCSAILASSL